MLCDVATQSLQEQCLVWKVLFVTCDHNYTSLTQATKHSKQDTFRIPYSRTSMYCRRAFVGQDLCSVAGVWARGRAPGGAHGRTRRAPQIK